MRLYQAILNNDVKHEAETLAVLHNNILNSEYDTLPYFTIQLEDEDGELVVGFDDKAFMNELREAFDEQVCEAHYAAEHNRSNRG